MKPQVYLIDIDGTLTNEVAWTSEDCLNATPKPEVIEWVNFKYKTDFIVIYTARKDHLYESTMKWLRNNGVMFHAVQFNKTPGIIVDLDAINQI